MHHGEQDMRTLKVLARRYITTTRDLRRVMSRLKAICRTRGIPCAGQQVYASRYRAEWLAKISEAGVRLVPNSTTSGSTPCRRWLSWSKPLRDHLLTLFRNGEISDKAFG